MSGIKVSIIDDDVSYIDSLKEVLKKNTQIHLYGEYNTGHEFINSLNSPFQPDVCLVDIVLKDMSGLECCRLIREKKPEVHLIIMTAYPNAETYSEARKLQADYIEKGTRIETIIDQVITLWSSSKGEERVVSMRKQEELKLLKYEELACQLDNAKEKLSALSENQIQVLKLKKEGKSNTEIADILNMGYGTVQTHITRAMLKLKLPKLLDFIFDD